MMFHRQVFDHLQLCVVSAQSTLSQFFYPILQHLPLSCRICSSLDRVVCQLRSNHFSLAYKVCFEIVATLAGWSTFQCNWHFHSSSWRWKSKDVSPVEQQILPLFRCAHPSFLIGKVVRALNNDCLSHVGFFAGTNADDS